MVLVKPPALLRRVTDQSMHTIEKIDDRAQRIRTLAIAVQIRGDGRLWQHSRCSGSAEGERKRLDARIEKFDLERVDP